MVRRKRSDRQSDKGRQHKETLIRLVAQVSAQIIIEAAKAWLGL